jgi:hypothetical protein
MAKKEEKEDKKPLKHKKTNGYHKTTVEHHPDGSHSIEHMHEDGSSNKYARPDYQGMMDGLQQNLSGPTPESTPPAGAAPVPGSMPQE